VYPTHHNYTLGDSFKRLDFEDQSIQLVVTTPPQPMIEKWDGSWLQSQKQIDKYLSKYDGKAAFEKMHELLDKTWKEVYRVLKPGGYACINISDATRSLGSRYKVYHNYSRIMQTVSMVGFDILPSIIWKTPVKAPNKYMGSGMLPAGAYVTLEHEHIIILRKGQKRSFSAEEKIKRGECAIFWEERNTWFTDIWDDIRASGHNIFNYKTIHRDLATPIDLSIRLILMFSIYGDTVLDPFGGMGTTTLAAIAAGRNSLYVEIDKHLVSLAHKTPTKRKTKGILNNLISERITHHQSAIDAKDMLFFRYRNLPMGMPVKTTQERKMALAHVKTISRQGYQIKANYKKVKPADLRKTDM